MSPSRRLVLPLAQLPVDAQKVGGKATQLGRLIRARLPVPDGFCVSPEALDEALRHPSLQAERRAFEAATAAFGHTTGAAVEAALDPLLAAAAPLRARLMTVPLADTLVTELELAWSALAADRVAVRSSALQEDAAEASFAGQHETVLGVESLPALLDALRRCWASLFSDAALGYRAARGVTGRAGMAVVVQHLLDPRTSGVLFTVNPMNGARREMSIDAGWGLGEAYVSGQASADSFLVSRPPNARGRGAVKLLHQVVVPKPKRLRPAPGGQLRWEDVPQAEREVPSLSPAEIQRVAALGLAAERLFGTPRDIEWALLPDGRLYLLQARPITVQSRPDTHRSRDDVLWTSRFSGERWSEPATPLGWSLIAPILNHFVYFDEAARRHLQGSLPTRLYRGYPYFNITIFRHLLFKLPGSPPPQFMLEFFPREEQREILAAPWIPPDLRLIMTILEEVYRERRWRRFAWQPLQNHKIWEAFLPELLGGIEAIPSQPADLAECQRAAAVCEAWIVRYLGIHVTSLAFASIFYQLLDVLVRRWAGRADPALLSALVTNSGGNKTVETNAALWSLAKEAHRRPAVRAALLSDSIPDLAQLAKLEGGPSFVAATRRFLADFGHRSSASWEIFSPRWEDDPAIPLGLARTWLEGGIHQDPELLNARSDRTRWSVEQEMLSDIGRNASFGRRAARRQIFKQVLELARSYSLLRENQRFYFDRLLLKTKRVWERMGALLVGEGRLEAASDLVFLTRGEVDDLLMGALPPEDASALARTRRAARERDLAADRPTFLRGEIHCTDPAQASGRTLTGLGISPGRITGRVRIIRTLAEGLKLRRGDILVTRATDPGWTPLFLKAGGLIMELGSLLSHGAVVAREYHLPAVVNISDATRLLKDGQTITVDGDRGLIFLH